MGLGGRNPYGCWPPTEASAPVALPTHGDRKRKRKKRSRPYNPRRDLERDDYVSGLPTPPRSPTPPGRPCRPLSSQAREPRERSRSRASTGSRGSRRATLPVRTRGIMFGELRPIPTDPALDPPPKVCYNCWQGGHSCVRCPRPPSVFCHNCGRHGADLTVCPRCQTAHRAYIRNTFGRDQPRLSASHRQGNMAAANPDPRRDAPQDVAPRNRAPVAQAGRPREQLRSTAPPRREVEGLPGPASSVAALVGAPVGRMDRVGRLPDTWRQENGPGSPPRSARRSDAPRATGDLPAVPAVPPRNESGPDGGALVPVAEALQLVSNLRDLPLEVRSAVLLRVFGQAPDPNPGAGQ